MVMNQYTVMLYIIEHYLHDLKITYTGLRGCTPMAKRRKQVESFNNEPDTMECGDDSILKRLGRDEIASILKWVPKSN